MHLACRHYLTLASLGLFRVQGAEFFTPSDQEFIRTLQLLRWRHASTRGKNQTSKLGINLHFRLKNLLRRGCPLAASIHTNSVFPTMNERRWMPSQSLLIKNNLGTTYTVCPNLMSLYISPKCWAETHLYISVIPAAYKLVGCSSFAIKIPSSQHFRFQDEHFPDLGISRTQERIMTGRITGIKSSSLNKTWC